MRFSYTQGVKILILFTLLFVAQASSAATLRISPDTGVYTVGKPFTVSVLLNTEGKAVNAADGSLSFNPRELQVVGVSRTASIFNLWTEEPTFSNTAGTVAFGGGSPAGYKGTAGSIVSVTFRALGAGTPKVAFKSGSALAADGMGTNVLTSMNGGSFTIAAVADSPAPEYIPPANTPQAPKVTSTTHPDQSLWYKEKTAKLSWDVPSGVTAIRTLLDTQPGTVPTVVYDSLITEKTLSDLPDGVSYFHIQFKNSDGWGRITHYKLAVDTEAPKNFTITEVQNDAEQAKKKLSFNFEDVSPITKYTIQIDGKDPFEYKDEDGSKTFTLEPQLPGYHTLTAEAFDSAGNSSIASYSFTVEAFEKPVFIEYPTRINTEVIPALKGTTRPRAVVSFTVTRVNDGSIINTALGGEENGTLETVSNEQGVFTFIPDKPFDTGVYAIKATARDEYGRVSEPSDEIRIIVEAPGYIVFGSLIINILSVFVPIIALLILLGFGSWYLWFRLHRWRSRVRKETLEVEAKLTSEFRIIVKNLNENVNLLKESRAGKLTKAEQELIERIESDLAHAQKTITKEIEDIEEIIT